MPLFTPPAATYTLPAASDTVVGGIELAIQSEMEAGTDALKAVTPGRQHFHPSAAKFWAKVTGNSTTIVVSYNMTSWADTNIGRAAGTIATDFSSADWAGFVSYVGTAGNLNNATGEVAGVNFLNASMAAGTFSITAAVSLAAATGAYKDPSAWMVAGFGDQ